MAPKKVYAVAKGRKPGIYNNWPAAKAQVEGFPGAVYKGFTTLKEAEAWIKNPGPGRAGLSSHNPKTGTCDSTSPNPGEITIYTDGGSSGNPGPGGYGVVQIYGNEKKELTGGFRLTTNNRMELMGVIVALKNLEYKNLPVTVYTDSSYVVNGITKGWAKNWRKNNWIKSDKKPALNPDLWSELLDLIEPLAITFRWVRGHAGNIYNERCDELAVSAAKGKNLPADKGYSG
ncbi:MAG TPA: ribonuclease HI [Spirochaetota bacterium]|nr:ribonuclease HI [Spirochaetota bacterium]